MQNSEQLYQALRRRGITTRLVYPDEHQGEWMALHKKDFLERRLVWYAQYVNGQTPKSAGEFSK